jgi:CCR4-NOT transcription complex subunit 2
MFSSTSTDTDHVRQALMKLSVAVREMTPSGAKQVSHTPDRSNLLARPAYGSCRLCGLPGHHSTNISHPAACRVALVSLIGFWEAYAMRLDNRPLKGGDMEVVLIDRLTGNFLKFLAHVRGFRAKVNLVLDEEDLSRYERVTKNLEGFFLGGLTCKLSHKLLRDDAN